MIQPISSIKPPQISFKTARTQCNTFRPIYIFDPYKAEQEKRKRTLKNISYGLYATAAIFAGVAAYKALTAKGLIGKSNPIKALKAEMQKFPKDIEYRKSILKDMNLPENDYHKLRSIIGTEELNTQIKILNKDKEHFLPGIKQYREDFEAIFPNRENVNSGKFAANLHLHTIYSDGKLTVPELMEQAAKYADQRVEKLGKENPFYLAITDHDTIQGCKEAVNIILKEPEKFKNLRLVLGIEHTTVTDYPEYLNGAVQTHMITYGLNPFNKELNNYLNKNIITNKENITNVLNYANKKFMDLLYQTNSSYSYEEFLKLAPEVQFGPRSADYYAKDYMQFKLIYTSAIENNKVLKNLFESKNISLDFTSPISIIQKNPDYSKGQRYYDHYFEALKSQLKSKLGKEYEALINSQLHKIPDELIKALEEIEHSVYTPQSKLRVEPVEFPSFKEVVEFIATQKDGVMGIAHPGVVFPKSNLRNDAATANFYNALYRDFKTMAGDKAIYAEDLYAAYYESNAELTAELAKISEKYGLEKIGGLDTHIADIFCSK